MPRLWQVTRLRRRGRQQRGTGGRTVKWRCSRDAGRAAAPTERLRRRNKGPGAESRGTARGDKAPGLRGQRRSGQATRAAGNKAALAPRPGPPRGRAAGTAPTAPRADRTPPAAAGLVTARPHAPEPAPPRRTASPAPPRDTASPPAPPIPNRGAPRTPGPPPAAGSQMPATFPVPSTRCPLRLTLSQQAPSSTNSRQNSNPREIPPAAFPCSSPPPLPSASLIAATRPPRRLSPLGRRREPATSRRPRTRGSCSLPSLETYPGDGACAGRSSAGEPSV